MTYGLAAESIGDDSGVPPEIAAGRRAAASAPAAGPRGAGDSGFERDRALLQSLVELRRVLHPLEVGHQALLRSAELAPSARALIAQQQRAVADASRLLDALAHVAELELRTRSPAEATFELADVVAKLVDAQGTAAQARSTAVHAQVAKVWVRGDRVLVRDLVGLLLGELLRAATAGGVAIGSRLEEGYVVLELLVAGRDADAPGAARADGVPTEPAGVTLAKRIADALGCVLSMRSSGGALVGARVRLRRSVAGAVSPGSAPRTARPSGGLHALIVDDDAAVRVATRLLLEAEGLDVRVAACRDEALACAAAEPPDVVIADWRLAPGESGLEVIAALRQRCGRRLPAVVLTGDVQAPDEPADVQVLTKPFAADDLLDAIARASGETKTTCAPAGLTSGRRAP